MSLNIQTATGLLEIGGKVTKEKVVEALGYEPANQTHTEDTTIHVTSAEKETWDNKSNFSGAYADLLDAPNITENDSGNVVIADESGNIIMQVDADGLATTNVSAKTIKLDGEDLGVRLDELESMTLPNIVDNESDNLSIADQAGNVIVKIDANGLETTTVTAKSAVINGVDIGTKLDEHLENAPNITEDRSGKVVFADESGNIIARIDEGGFETTIVTAQSVVVNGTNVELALDGKAASAHTHDQYLEASDITGKADKIYVDTELDKKANNVHTHDEYLVADDIADKADKSELHSHNNKTELDKIVDGKVGYWDAKSEFSGDYNDLENAPNIYEDNSNNMVIADQAGNIIFRSDAGGVETTTLTAQSVVVNGTELLPITVDSRLDYDSTNPLQNRAIAASLAALNNEVVEKQQHLVSGTNIKTINGESILGAGDLTVGVAVDDAIVEGSTNPVQGGAVYNAMTTLQKSLWQQVTENESDIIELQNAMHVNELTAADNNKVLMVVNGKWQLATLKIYVNDDGIISLVPIVNIAFTVNGVSYTAEYGMTWSEWLESDYCPSDNFKADGGIVDYYTIGNDTPEGGVVKDGYFVYLTDTIVAGCGYVVDSMADYQ